MSIIDFSKNIISDKATIFDAVRALHEISAQPSLTLLVTDQHDQMVGTVTDGDVRRAIIRGCGLDHPITELMNTQFTYIEQGKFDDVKLRHIKREGFKLIPVLDQQGRVVSVADFSNGHSYLPIDAVLMAGGRGERLRPATLTTPKPLLEVAGKPIIDYNIDNLLQVGIENIHVTVNYLAEQIEAHFAPPRTNGVQVQCVREPQFLGTMGSIKFVQEWHNDTVLVMNSDLFTNIDIEDFYLHFKTHDAAMSIAAVPYSVNIPYGIFEIENTREICGVKEKPSYHYYANAGIYLLKREVLNLIPEGEFFNATDMMSLLIERGRKVIRFPLSGFWIDIGKPEDFRKAQDLAQHTHKV